MRRLIAIPWLLAIVYLTLSASGFAQTPSQPQKQRQSEQPSSAPEKQQDLETLKIDTNLVTLPVIATDVKGLYIPDLRKEEFSISEDGVQQNIAFFNTVSTPFHVILMLDTSASTEDKLRQIKNAAVAFVEQLQPKDRVKVISFDDQVRDLNEFTNDRIALKDSIMKTRSGEGTKLYDAFQLALDSIRRIQGRKAIVIFTDGVDWHSDEATFDGTLRGLDEEGVIVYPIRYETRAETEAIARGQAGDPGTQLPTIGVIRAPAPGTTAPTFPGDGSTIPTRGSRPTSGPLGLPSPADILRGRRTTDPYPPDDRLPPGSRVPPNGPLPDPRNDPRGTSRPTRRADDSIGAMLDQLYMKADSYLEELANKSGGRLLRADTLGSLPDAFARIAAELRTQYSLGYYPTNAAHDGQYRRVKVNTTRKDVLVRARPGYRAPSGN